VVSGISGLNANRSPSLGRFLVGTGPLYGPFIFAPVLFKAIHSV
jgi:hypothetical protein